MLITEKSKNCNYSDHQFYERRFLGISFYDCKLCKKRISNRSALELQILIDARKRHDDLLALYGIGKKNDNQ